SAASRRGGRRGRAGRRSSRRGARRHRGRSPAACRPRRSSGSPAGLADVAATACAEGTPAFSPRRPLLLSPTTPPDGPRSRSDRENRVVAKKTREYLGPPLDPVADAKSRRRARWWWWATGVVIVGLVLWVLTTGGESDRGNKITAPRDFCRASA